MTTKTEIDYTIGKLFWKLAPAYIRFIEKSLKELGTTPHRLRLISILCDRGPIPMNNLAEEVGVTSANVTGLVDALERDGYVVRKPLPKDRRVILIAPTKKAKKYLETSRPIYREKISNIFKIFSGDEKEQFLYFLNRLEDYLSDADTSKTTLAKARYQNLKKELKSPLVRGNL
ncbi:MAG: MarR family winged helix-turn-helix transcriptional regulator [Bacteriovoracia bacterium]